ncbi:octopamine receptor 1-like [Bacillus rossius redtenbacheri]|uniref:octopamine receptor 1-like n=1 Tax=Bacillus rossius redtenbacheri TaxID=93214 RepID=UPI002FDC8975
MEEVGASNGSNASSEVTPPTHLPWQHVSLITLLCIVIIITVVGNTLIILAVLTTRRLRTVTNCFIMSLSVADWLVGIFVMPPEVVRLSMAGAWKLGWALCEIWVSLDILLCTASILSLCAISVDRYLAVTRPLTYSRKTRSKRLAMIMILVVWLTAVAITCPPIFGWYDAEHNKPDICRYNQNVGYVVFSAMGSFFLPLVVMLYVYMRISCVVAHRHSQLNSLDNSSQRSSRFITTNHHEESEQDHSECEDVNLSSTFPSIAGADGPRFSAQHHRRSLRSHYTYCAAACGEQHQQHQQHQRGATLRRAPPEESSASRVSSFRQESKTTQVLSVVVGGFVACWLPFFVVYLLQPFLPPGAVPSLIMAFLVWLGWINSAMNPFIYAFYNPDFRIAFWRLTFRHCFKSRKPMDPALQRHK